MTTYTIEVNEDRITVYPAIDGVEIEANLRDDKWHIRDGYNSFVRETQDEAVSSIKESISFYSEEDCEIVVAR